MHLVFVSLLIIKTLLLHIETRSFANVKFFLFSTFCAVLSDVVPAYLKILIKYCYNLLSTIKPVLKNSR